MCKRVPAAAPVGACKPRTALAKAEVLEQMQARAGRELKWWHVCMAHPSAFWRKCGPPVSVYDVVRARITFPTRHAFFGPYTSRRAHLRVEYKAEM